jgi:hypothetical protein
MAEQFKPRLELLPPAQRALWAGLRPVAEDGFVLYGGTAIALRLGHRVSVDFDFFSAEGLDQDRVLGRYPFCASATVLQAAPDTLSILVPGAQGSVKVSFFGGIAHGRVGEPAWTDDGVLQVASLEDLLATKLKTIQQRVEKKDYLDIHAMLGAGLRLETALAGARALYGKSFQPIVALKALTYFEDGDLADLPAQLRHELTKSASNVKELPSLPRIHAPLGGAQ